MGIEHDFYSNHNCKNMPVFKDLEAKLARLREEREAEKAEYESLHQFAWDNRREADRLREDFDKAINVSLAKDMEIDRLRREVAMLRDKYEGMRDA